MWFSNVQSTTPSPDPHLVSLLAPQSFAAEQYRCLRLTLEERSTSRDSRLLAITSAVPNDGKTVTAINLAGALAQAPLARVLLIDGDLRHPSVAKRLGLPDDGTPGLDAALQTPQTRWQDLVRQTETRGLSVLPTMTSRSDSYELFNSPRLPQLLNEARREYDFVIVDTPPLFPVPDSRLLSKSVDGYVVVVAANATPRKLLGEALNLLAPSSVLGLVFNRDDRTLFGYYKSSYQEYFTNYINSLNREHA